MPGARRVRIPQPEPTSSSRPPAPSWLVFALPLAYGLLLAPIAALNVLHAEGRASFDQVLFHQHTIEALARTWPDVNLTYPDHFVAMTPGFHWVMGGVVRATGLGGGGLRLVGLALAVAIFAGLTAFLARRCGPLLGPALIAPFMASVYVANSSAWLLADNAGWMWVFALSCAALCWRPNPRWAAMVGLGLLLAVWTRQNLLFLALPIWAAAWLREPPAGPASANPLRGMPRRAMNLLPVALATFPSIATLAYLYTVWGGLVPHEFQGQYDGANPANLALQLVMLGGLAPFFLPAMFGVGEPGWCKHARGTLRRSWPWMLAGGAMAGLVAAIAPTTHAPTEGRAGLVWSAADTLNVLGPIGHTNPVIVAAAAGGGVLFVAILALAPPRQRWILGAVFAGFAVAQGASSEVWQRYHEPFALLFLAIATMVAVSARRPAWRRPPPWQWGPIAALALAMAATTAAVLWQREINPWRHGASQTPVSSLLPEPPEDPEAPADRP